MISYGIKDTWVTADFVSFYVIVLAISFNYISFHFKNIYEIR